MESESSAIVVDALLKAAGITLTGEPFETLVRLYPYLRAGSDSLYIPETRYETPALLYHAS